jgi:hypothetical protein
MPVASLIRANYRPHFYPIQSPAGFYTNLVNENPVGPNNLSKPQASVTATSNHDALLDLLRASKAEKDKIACRMTVAQHNVFHIISNGKSFLGPLTKTPLFSLPLHALTPGYGGPLLPDQV